MMEEDPERGDANDGVVRFEEEEEIRTSWVVPAIRRQNRYFVVGTVCMLLALAVLFVTGTYQEQEEGTLGEYDSDGGTVGNDANNGKMQEALDKMDKIKHGKASEWFHVPEGYKNNPFPHNGPQGGLLGNRNHTFAGLHHGSYGNRNHTTHVSSNNQTNPYAGHSVGGTKDYSSPFKGGSHGNYSHFGGGDGTISGGGDGTTQEDIGGDSAPSDWYSTPVTLESGVMYNVVDQLTHDSGAFTQGLTFFNGSLWESTGLFGKSSVRELDPETGAVKQSIKMPSAYFGEGMTYYDGKLVQITWKAGIGFVYNASDLLKASQQFSYTTPKNNEGWGITYDPDNDELIVSDGSNVLSFWDPVTYETRRTLQVYRIDGTTAASRLNELEFWRGRILANVWYEDVILVIHPKTGKVEKEYDLSKLWPQIERPKFADCLNGISVADDPAILYVTGKKWDRIYKLQLLP